MRDLDSVVLHWLPEANLWETISWDSWMAFRGIFEQRVPLASVGGGVHHFMVCVLDDDGTVVNIIPHKYLIEPNGSIGRDNFAGFTKEDREEDMRLMRLRQCADRADSQFNDFRYPFTKQAALPDAHIGSPDDNDKRIGPIQCVRGRSLRRKYLLPRKTSN